MAKSIKDPISVIERHPIRDLIMVDENGFPSERAMFTAKIDDDFTVYFGTFPAANKCRHIASNPGVMAVWPTGSGYISLRGNAVILDDKKSREHTWHGAFYQYFKGGSSDPDFIVVKIKPVSLAYYEEGFMEAEIII